MIGILTAKEMKKYDHDTINNINIPELVLMERAALGARDFLNLQFPRKNYVRRSVMIVSGTGNNGADGLALARMLKEDNWETDIVCIGDVIKCTESWKIQKNIVDYYEIEVSSKPAEKEYTVIVDAMFGIGLSRPLSDEYLQIIKWCNNQRGYKLSLDIPSGINADTGECMGDAFKADATVTFGFWKRGLVFYPGSRYCGEVHCVDIGIPRKMLEENPPELFALNEAPETYLPERSRDGNKGTFGKVLILAGSNKMAGAAILAARSAYRAGAGMVKLISAPENREIIQCSIPEALFDTYDYLTDSLDWADVLLAGPGLGTEKDAKNALENMIRKSNVPMILDADAINLIAKEESLFSILKQKSLSGQEIVLTPHVGELARLIKKEIPEVKKNLLDYGRKLAKELKAVVVAKDARTFICSETGKSYVNLSGNNGLATAGSGDVLAGIISGFVAQNKSVLESAVTGTYVHGCLGDLVSKTIGEHSCMAGDLITIDWEISKKNE